MKNIFEGIEYTIMNETKTNYTYNEMEYDSRKIKKNDIFVAMEGFTVDGHNYIKQAIDNGAKLIIVSKEVEIIDKNINYVLVKNLRENLGIISSNYYQWPQKKIKIVGVTGTNGKTTTTYILEHIIGNAARLGTIEYKIGDEIIEAQNTTPESLDVVKMCKKALDKNIDKLIMEVSSHALSLGRVKMLEFETAIFTNLTQDHLDFHKSMDNYFAAKTKLFDMLKEGKKGVVNIDDPYGEKLYFLKNNKVLSYGIDKKADIYGKINNFTNHDMEISIIYQDNEYKIKTELMGKFNLYNILGSFGAAISLGYEKEYIIERLKTVKKVPGRFETVNAGQDFMAVVDYAHTDDGLLNILSSLTEIKTKRLITVFGAGGDRDKTKRPKMAKVAAKYSDFVIITSDNPRTENPENILKDVIAGMEEINFAKENYKTIVDREEAIKYAISIMKKDDILLVAGKGHETYQIIGREKRHFDDREIIRKYTDQRGQTPVASLV